MFVSGRLVELFEYEMPVPYDYEAKYTRRVRCDELFCRLDHHPYVRQSVQRSARNLKRLCFSNSWQWPSKTGKPIMPIFITFTFKENVTDTKYAHKEFTKMIERLNYQWREYIDGKLKYVAVPERQKRGALHYHLLAFNLPYIPMAYDWLSCIWQHGFAKMEKLKDEGKLASYVSKYMGKDLTSGREFNGKRYFASCGLKRPTQFRSAPEVDMILKEIPVSKSKMWTKEIVPPKNSRVRTGKIRYTRFLLPESIDLLSVEEAFGPKMPSLESGEPDTMVSPTGGSVVDPAQESPLNNPSA
jgi:hypothetical protein